MTTFESKVGAVPENDQKIFHFLSDLRNLGNIIPADRIKNWKAETETCHFSVDGLGEAGLKIIEKEPFSVIRLAGDGPYNIDFSLKIIIHQVGEKDSRIKLVLEAELSPMIKILIDQAAEVALDAIVDHLARIDYSGV
jgi:carbon monoxide dehydrogenase subunit G